MLTTDRENDPAIQTTDSITQTADSKPVRKRGWYAKSAAAFRWVHIYISMLGFTTLMFFAFTGITLNHPTWFGAAEQTVRDIQGTISKDIINVRSVEVSPTDVGDNEASSITVDRLGIAEWLRSEHKLRGRVTEFNVDEYECMLVFKSPGYAADIFLDHTNGQYMLTETSTGIMAVLNDLHKGRDSGPEWSLVIDISAVVTMLLSASGFGLLLYLRRRRISGILTAVVGTIALVAAWAVWVP